MTVVSRILDTGVIKTTSSKKKSQTKAILEMMVLHKKGKGFFLKPTLSVLA